MRIESLNIWGGRERTPLLKHLGDQAEGIDVFCLQEVFKSDSASAVDSAVPDIFLQIADVLPNHVGYFEPAHGSEGLAMFVRHDLTVTGCGSTVVHRWDIDPRRSVDQNRILQFLQVDSDGREITIANLHGLHLGKNKGDTKTRIAQFLAAKSEAVRGPTVLCGDFNVRPGTASLKVFENDGNPKRRMANLVTDPKYAITTTRSPLFEFRKESPFADYIFVTPPPLLTVVSFEVLTDVVVSDHYPLVVKVQ